LEAAKKAGPAQLNAFLRTFPKGGDLHMHLSGAIYAETFIAEAVQAGFCVAPVDPVPADGLPPVPTPQGAVKFVAPGTDGCPPKSTPASSAFANQKLYDALINSFSMRAFVPTPGISGHDQFFATFERYGGLNKFAGAWLDEVATRAAQQNEQYLEIMQTPPAPTVTSLSKSIGWPAGAEKEISRAQLAELRSRYLEAGLANDVAGNTKYFADTQAARNSIEHCAPASGAADRTQPPACNVRIHWIYQILRGNLPQQVFAQTLLAFEVAKANPDVVGINFVQPEDGRISMQDYHLQMLMLDYLSSVPEYAGVNISLHAGELAPGMVPPDGLRFHIREAVELGHARRIGHGVDVLYEDRPNELLKEMADKHIDVEVNLTSNDGILGIKGPDHPLSAYRAAKVPFSLSTDDEGVSRGNLTQEYTRAVLEQNLTYADLKQSARNSLEHSFLPGKSLFTNTDDYVRRIPACSAAITATSKPSTACADFLKSNERAEQQYELERRFAVFEAGPF
jgi:adenosine deaminase